MTPTLQILIPTYNRPDKLSFLITSLTFVEDLCISGDIKISIFDNSDSAISMVNRERMPNFVSYSANKINLGFSGNIVRCLEESEGKYSWIISDDDDIIVDELFSLVSYLKLCPSDVIAISIPYFVSSIYNGTNTFSSSLKKTATEAQCLHELVKENEIPFALLSCCIFKTEALKKVDFKLLNIQNSYFHVAAYLSAMNRNDLVQPYGKALVFYHSDTTVRFSLLNLIQSREEIVDLLQVKHQILMNRKALLKAVLMWAVHGRIGKTNIQKLELERIGLFVKSLKSYSLFNYALGIIIILPKFLSRFLVYNFFPIFSRSNSELGFFSKYIRNRTILRNNNNA